MHRFGAQHQDQLRAFILAAAGPLHLVVLRPLFTLFCPRSHARRCCRRTL